MRVVVTGAGGFAGTWLCRQLVSDGFQVVGWVRSVPARPVTGIEYRIQDVRDSAGCRRAMGEDQPYRVFHLAALTHLADCTANPVTATDTNVRGTRNVFGAMPSFATGLLASTCHVYGQPHECPIDESHPLGPKGAYAQSKLEAESAALAVSDSVVIARAFHHTGPGQAPRYALAGWARQLAGGEVPIRVGDLSLGRDYTDVRDICSGYRVLVDRGESGQAYNLCSGKASVLEDLLAQLNGGALPAIERIPERMRPNEVKMLVGSPVAAVALGWNPTVSLAQSLTELRESFA